MSIWKFKINRAPERRPVKQNALICAHGGMQKWGFNYWENYYPLVNYMSVRFMLTLIILRELHTKYVVFVQAYTQVQVNPENFMNTLNIMDNPDI